MKFSSLFLFITFSWFFLIQGQLKCFKVLLYTCSFEVVTLESRMPIAVPSKRSQSYTRQSSRSSTASSGGSGNLAASGSLAGSSSFLAGRSRERVAEMELFR